MSTKPIKKANKTRQKANKTRQKTNKTRQKAIKTRQKANKTRQKTNKTRQKAKGLNRPTINLSIIAKHESEGDIAQKDIIEALPGLPQNKENEEHGLGALRRQNWMEKQDFNEYIRNIVLKGTTQGILMPKHLKTRNLRDEEISEIANALTPFKTINCKRKKNKK